MMEQIYNDFTTKLLPQIQAGLVISKEYFTDLFGRYVHYLIISDIVYLSLSVSIFFIGIFLFWKGIQMGRKIHWGEGIYIGFIVVGFGTIIITFLISVNNATNLIKDKYIPEVRVYEELKGFNSQK